MADRDELVQWLRTQPLDADVPIEGESVYLRLRPGGAELGAYLWRDGDQAQLLEALQQGFASACHFDAALGHGPDGQALVLSQWLPGVRAWDAAADALALLLEQLAHWRAELEPPPRRGHAPARHSDRQEQRMRSLLAGGRR